MSEKKVIDWEKIELDYRAGVKSLREIAAEHDISDGAIRKRAKRDDWSRDLSAKINAKAEDLVRKDLVRSEVRTQTAISEKETIDANAHQQAAVRLSQRKDIQRSRSIAMQLFDELEHQVGVANVELLEALGDLMRSEDEKGQDKLNDIYHKIISLPGRVKSMKDLSDTLRNLIALERQAFGLDDKDNNTVDPLQSLLNSIAQGNNSAFSPVAEDKDYEN
jgi:DNA anti-recombination protein RmuC